MEHVLLAEWFSVDKADGAFGVTNPRCLHCPCGSGAASEFGRFPGGASGAHQAFQGLQAVRQKEIVCVLYPI